MTRYCRDRRHVLSAERQRRQLDQYGRWDSDSVSDYGRDLTTSVIEVIRCTLDAIHTATHKDLHLVAHLLGPVRKTKTCDLHGSGTGLTCRRRDAKSESLSRPLIRIFPSNSKLCETTPDDDNAKQCQARILRQLWQGLTLKFFWYEK
ncbi:hypothetical protein TNCV_2735571 [Trichonephila clavipes]|nr:hypothetical protein TNCV_2735571 [Trichonephila clavipes]